MDLIIRKYYSYILNAFGHRRGRESTRRLQQIFNVIHAFVFHTTLLTVNRFGLFHKYEVLQFKNRLMSRNCSPSKIRFTHVEFCFFFFENPFAVEIETLPGRFEVIELVPNNRFEDNSKKTEFEKRFCCRTIREWNFSEFYAITRFT